jgi:hypothetical protein
MKRFPKRSNIEYQIFYFKIPTFKQNQFISEREADLGDELILCFPNKEFIGGFRKAYQSYCPDIIYYLPINYEHFCDYVYPNLVGV